MDSIKVKDEIEIPEVGLRKSGSYLLLTIVGTCLRATGRYIGNGAGDFPPLFFPEFIFCCYDPYATNFNSIV